MVEARRGWLVAFAKAMRDTPFQAYMLGWPGLLPAVWVERCYLCYLDGPANDGVLPPEAA